MPKKKYRVKVYRVIMLDSVIKSDEKYYPKIFLEECKYAQEKIKTKNYIGIELKSESDTDNDTDNDE